MQKTLLYLIALIVLGAAAYGVYVYGPRLGEPSSATAASRDGGGEVTVREETSTYAIHVTYRRFGIPTVDAQLDAAVTAAILAFKEQVELYPPVEDSAVQQYTLDGEAGEFYSGSDVLAERINLYQYTGGAHGLPIVMALNYDARTGEELTLDDALILTGLTLEDVSGRSLAQLHQEFGESVFEEGAHPQKDNYSTFVISPQQVTFVFPAYQVVAYAAGMPEVSFARVQ